MVTIQDEHGWGLAHGAIDDIVLRQTDGDDYGVGAVEAATRTGHKTRECLARLIMVLVRRGAVNLDDVPEILGFGSDCTITLDDQGDRRDGTRWQLSAPAGACRFLVDLWIQWIHNENR